MIRVCVLPERASSWGGSNPNPSSGQWDTFIKWLQPKIGSHLAVQRYNPTRIPIDVTVYVYVYEEVDLVVKRTEVEDRIRSVFKHKNGFLGRSVAIDDISDAIKFTDNVRDSSIDYLTINQPIEDIKPDSSLKFISLRNLNVVVKYTQRNR